jgi:uncharacterized protein (DUF58 family)
VLTHSSIAYLKPEVLRALQNLELAARLLVEGLYASRHRCPFYGYTVEFKDYREYVPGDAPRMIDWKVLARTDRYVVKRYEMESNMDVLCLLDASGSMGYAPQDRRRLSKFEYGCYLAAGLSYLVVRQQDAAGLVTHGEDVRDFVPCRQGTRHLHNLLAVLQRVSASGGTGLAASLRTAALRLKRRTIVVVIGDCHDDEGATLDGIRKLAAQGHEVVMMQVLDADEVNFPFEALMSFRDIETGAQLMCDPVRQRQRYLEKLETFRYAIRDGCAACGADYRLFDTSQPVETALREYLVFRRSRG